MNQNKFSDRMILNDDLIITNPLKVRPHHDQAAPHGRLFEILDVKNGRRLVREIACNTVVVGGAITALENLTGGTPTWRPSTINQIHNVPATSDLEPKIYLFGAGIGGAQPAFGIINDVDIKQRDVLVPVPMRANSTGTIDTGDADRYFMHGQNPETDMHEWWLKRFAETPTIKSCWKNAVDEEEDGQEITSDIYNIETDTGIETFAEFTLDFSIYDVREHFEAIGDIANARYNTFGIYTGSLNAEGTEYANVRLYAAVAFNNRPLDIKTKATYLYRIYSMI